MEWSSLLLMVISFCGGAHVKGDPNSCRHERIECLNRAAARHPGKNNNGVEIVDRCLKDPKDYSWSLSVPAPSPSSNTTLIHPKDSK